MKKFFKLDIMKKFILSIVSFFILVPFMEIRAQILEYSKLELRKNQVYSIQNEDTSGTLAVDTLIMNDHAKIILYGKTEFNILARNAFIGHNCMIIGHDAENNGTDLNIQMCFKSLERLEIRVSGQNRFDSRSEFPNGDGGDVHFFYDSTGEIPQTKFPRRYGYVYVDNLGAQGTDHPETDLEIIHQEIRSGSSIASRPLTGLKSGLIFDVKPGKDGLTEFKTLDF